MSSWLHHLLYRIDMANVPYYRELFTSLGWRVVRDTDDVLGVVGANGELIEFTGPYHPDVTNDYDGKGLNHLAVAVASVADVDAFVGYMADCGIVPQFETPRHRPEFAEYSAAVDSDYYHVMFTSPDNLLLEVVYAGSRQP
ncbi:MAG: hypothetical protein WBA46_05380 [Thermomicrobiales bacterium]